MPKVGPMKRKNTRAQRRADDGKITQLVNKVLAADTAFKKEWPMASLRLCNPDLHAKLVEQVDWFNEAAVTGEDFDQIMEEGEACLRGYEMATKAMAMFDDDEALVIWSDELGGYLIMAHGFGRRGDGDIVVTPAEIISWLLSMPNVLASKREFPDAELTFKPKEDDD